jgi:uncharacterized membrane protein (UPF0127 family)
MELDGCPRAYVAATARARLLDLAWLDGLPEECGLLIPRCGSVHTFGMRFALDIDFLDAELRLLRRVEAVPARRVVWHRGAAAVLERSARRCRVDRGHIAAESARRDRPASG